MDNIPMVQENEIVNFFRKNGSFLSEAAKELITRTADAVINEAACSNPDIMEGLLTAANHTTDPYFRRKVIKAL